jgi:GNAT superfamily N-acetyltransferase
MRCKVYLYSCGKNLLHMIFREALLEDIEQIQLVRHSVRENILSDPLLVTDDDCAHFLTVRGKGWVCDDDSMIVGFAIADLLDQNIWALFIRPEFERKGIGTTLHELMLDWYFAQGQSLVWLGTAPGTRAELFYKKAGWRVVGTHGKGEVKFEMTSQEWAKNRLAAG